MTDRPKIDAAGIEEFRQRAWDIMREDDYNDANAICDLALRGLAQQFISVADNPPKDGEWVQKLCANGHVTAGRWENNPVEVGKCGADIVQWAPLLPAPPTKGML